MDITDAEWECCQMRNKKTNPKKIKTKNTAQKLTIVIKPVKKSLRILILKY